MAKSGTSITPEKRKKMKPRGRGKKIIILEAIKSSSLVGVRKNSSDETAEKAFFGHIASIAFDSDDKERGMCIRLLADKGWGNVKPSSECVNFDFDVNGSVHEQAIQIISAASNGIIPPDIANTLVNSMSSMLKIQEVTDLENRIRAIEDAIESD